MKETKQNKVTTEEIWKALDKSIEHWEKDIITPLRDEKIAIVKDWTGQLKWGVSCGDFVPSNSCDCPMCRLFDDNCVRCPLEHHNVGCNHIDSPWMKFLLNPCLSTALHMKETLIAIKLALEIYYKPIWGNFPVRKEEYLEDIDVIEYLRIGSPLHKALEASINQHDVDRNWLHDHLGVSSFRHLTETEAKDTIDKMSVFARDEKTEKLVNAIDKSIKHWEKDICQPLMRGDKIEVDSDNNLRWSCLEGGLFICKRVPIFGEDCPLCWYILNENKNCGNCPLSNCNDDDSPWKRFYGNPCLANARAMVSALKNARQKVLNKHQEILKKEAREYAARIVQKLKEEKEEKAFEYFETGTIFQIIDPSLCPWELKETPMVIGKLDENNFCSLAPISHFVQLAHVQRSKEYTLMHLGTGYKFVNGFFRRTGKGIEIRKEVLDNLKLIYNPKENIIDKKER